MAIKIMESFPFNKCSEDAYRMSQEMMREMYEIESGSHAGNDHSWAILSMYM